MEIKERISRAIIQIQKRNSFFAYLSLFLKFKENQGELPEYAGAGVDIKGNFTYNKELFEELDDDELQGIIIHEILHIALLHLTRLGGRDMQLWNIATDLAINTMVVNNGFVLPKKPIVANYNDFYEGFGAKISNVSTKAADELYNEFQKQISKNEEENQKGNGKGKDEGDEKEEDNQGEGEGNENEEETREENQKKSPKKRVRNYKNYKGFDNHNYSSDISESEKKELEKEIEDRLREAYTMSQMRGDLPKGVERLVNNLGKQKINWKNVLNKFISNSLPYDYTYSRPSKKSISVGEYLPSIHKEKIDVSVVLDLSGSVGDEEFRTFFTEIVGIARAYQERIDMEVYTHDTECYYAGKVRNGNIEQLKRLKFKGGGGTSFQCVVDKLNEMKKNPKCVIWITDGYAEEIDKQKYPILWVLTKDGDDENLTKSGKVIRLED